MPGPNLLGSSAQLQNSLNTIRSRFDLLRDFAGVMRPLMTAVDLQPGTGRSYNRVNYGRALASQLTDGQDMIQQQDLSDANTSFTPNEIGVQLILPRTTLRRSADQNLETNAAMIMEHAYSLKEDQDCCSIFPSFTTQLGGATTVLGIGHAAGAEVRLRMGNSLTTPEPVVADIYFVAHPCSLHAVAMRITVLTDVPAGTNVYTPTAAGATLGPGHEEGLGEDILAQGRKAIKMLGGMTIVEDANLTASTNSGYHSGAFGREGAVFVSEFEPDMQEQPDWSLRARELNWVGSYATGVWRPAAKGIDMLFDATLPTA